MKLSIKSLKKALVAGAAIAMTMSLTSQAMAEKFRLSASASATDERAKAVNKFLAPAINSFGKFEAHWGQHYLNKAQS